MFTSIDTRGMQFKEKSMVDKSEIIGEIEMAHWMAIYQRGLVCPDFLKIVGKENYEGIEMAQTDSGSIIRIDGQNNCYFASFTGSNVEIWNPVVPDILPRNQRFLMPYWFVPEKNLEEFRYISGKFTVNGKDVLLADNVSKKLALGLIANNEVKTTLEQIEKLECKLRANENQGKIKEICRHYQEHGFENIQESEPVQTGENPWNQRYLRTFQHFDGFDKSLKYDYILGDRKADREDALAPAFRVTRGFAMSLIFRKDIITTLQEFMLAENNPFPQERW